MGMNPKPVRRVDSLGNQRWLLNDQLHRTTGPAVIAADGTQWWYQNGLLHRTDGPAVVWADGSQEWWVNDKNITRAVEKWMKSRAVSWPWPDEETRVEFLLTWTI